MRMHVSDASSGLRNAFFGMSKHEREAWDFPVPLWLLTTARGQDEHTVRGQGGACWSLALVLTFADGSAPGKD